jgi:hypothetical protein
LLPSPVIPHNHFILSTTVATTDIIVNLFSLLSLITTGYHCRYQPPPLDYGNWHCHCYHILSNIISTFSLPLQAFPSHL